MDREGILLVRSAMWGPGGPSIRSSICSKLFQILRSSIFENYHKSRMPQSRRHERPRSFHLDHSASLRATKPNKASMSLMLAAASICTTDMLERHLAPPGFECCERELLGRPWRREWGMCNFRSFSKIFQNFGVPTDLKYQNTPSAESRPDSPTSAGRGMIYK